MTAYNVRVSPEVCGNNRNKENAFCIAQYQEEVKQSEAIISDGVFEMMNVAAYVHFAQKPKNGGFDADEARGRWELECKKPDAVCDTLGPTAKLARRVAIKVKDLVIQRDMTERSRTECDAIRCKTSQLSHKFVCSQLQWGPTVRFRGFFEVPFWVLGLGP